MSHHCCTVASYGDVDMIENPPINPIYGSQRSAATVRSELRAYYNSTRRNAAIPPIYFSDYLFFTVRGKGVRLGRVVHAPYGGALLSHDKIDLTEYEHIPDANSPRGFFGVFKPLQNEQYDPQIKAKGVLQFVRHRDVSRDDVVVFHVQMTGSSPGVNLRVHMESLQRLAEVCPDMHGLPPRLPATHAGQVGRLPQITHRAAPAAEQSAGSSREHAIVPVAAGRPMVQVGDRIEVYWKEKPKGWFAGSVTSNARENNVWVSRVKYDACVKWKAHFVWHALDPQAPNSVKWRYLG